MYADSGLSTSDLIRADSFLQAPGKNQLSQCKFEVPAGKKISWLSFCRQRGSNEVSSVPSHVLFITFSSKSQTQRPSVALRDSRR